MLPESNGCEITDCTSPQLFVNLQFRNDILFICHLNILFNTVPVSECVEGEERREKGVHAAICMCV